MKKRAVCFILALTLIVGGVFVIQRISSGRRNYEDAVSHPETAVAIAIAILNEHSPPRDRYEIFDFQVEGNNGIWVVQRIAPPPLGVIDDEVFITLGRRTRYVHIRKSNGEILRIGIK